MAVPVSPKHPIFLIAKMITERQTNVENREISLPNRQGCPKLMNKEEIDR